MSRRPHKRPRSYRSCFVDIYFGKNVVCKAFITRATSAVAHSLTGPRHGLQLISDSFGSRPTVPAPTPLPRHESGRDKHNNRRGRHKNRSLNAMGREGTTVHSDTPTEDLIGRRQLYELSLQLKHIKFFSTLQEVQF